VAPTSVQDCNQLEEVLNATAEEAGACKVLSGVLIEAYLEQHFAARQTEDARVGESREGWVGVRQCNMVAHVALNAQRAV